MRGVVIVGFSVACALITGCDAIDGFSEAKEAVSRNLKDPAATQFRDLQSCFKDQKVVMGEFNAKNSYGAYTGFQRFLYTDGEAVTFEDHNYAALADRCYGREMSSVDKTAKELADDAAEAARDAVSAAR